ncbi:hypothetical protein A3731_23130 [Roseovarius sp. HI0049]|nr:hypothetical protein A3731_23130 [Roseovarius sp. HI0049]
MPNRDDIHADAPSWARELGETAEGAPVGDLLALAEVGLVSRDPRARNTAARMLVWIRNADRSSTLGKALELERSGWKNAQRMLRTAERNAALRRVAEECRPGASTSAQARDLAVKWRRWAADAAHRPAPPFEGEPAATFRRLAEAGHDPIGQRQLQEILSRELAISPPVETATGARYLEDKKDGKR